MGGHFCAKGQPGHMLNEPPSFPCLSGCRFPAGRDPQMWARVIQRAWLWGEGGMDFLAYWFKGTCLASAGHSGKEPGSRGNLQRW